MKPIEGSAPSVVFVSPELTEFPEGSDLALVRSDADQVEGITEVQREAIEETMRLILEEDRARGVSLDEKFKCRSCGHLRQLAGSVDYDSIRLCHRCATRFEVQRVGGRVRTCAEYVGRRKAKTYS